MRRLVILAALIATGVTAAGLSAQGQPAISDIEQVSDRVWKIYGAGGNTTIFVRADGVALVDTKLANNGAAILAQVRKVTDKPVTLIVNTHSHGTMSDPTPRSIRAAISRSFLTPTPHGAWARFRTWAHPPASSTTA